MPVRTLTDIFYNRCRAAQKYKEYLCVQLEKEMKRLELNGELVIGL